jgi:hypothetical protein
MNPAQISDFLRVSALQTVRALSPPVTTRGLDPDAQQTGAQYQQQARGSHTMASAASADAPTSTSVALSPAARLAPSSGLDGLGPVAVTSATRLATALVDLTSILHDPSRAPGETGPALRLAVRLRMLSESAGTANPNLTANLTAPARIETQVARARYAAMQPLRADDSSIHDVQDASGAITRMDPRSPLLATQVLAAPQPDNPRATGVIPHGAAAYLAAPGMPRTFARVDVQEFGREPSSGGSPGAQVLGTTIHVKLQELGEVTVTVALSGQHADIAVAGSQQAIDLLKQAEPGARTAIGAWGINIRKVHWVPFDAGPS